MPQTTAQPTATPTSGPVMTVQREVIGVGSYVGNLDVAAWLDGSTALAADDQNHAVVGIEITAEQEIPDTGTLTLSGRNLIERNLRLTIPVGALTCGTHGPSDGACTAECLDEVLAEIEGDAYAMSAALSAAYNPDEYGDNSLNEPRYLDAHHAVLIDGTLCGYTTRTEN